MRPRRPGPAPGPPRPRKISPPNLSTSASRPHASNFSYPTLPPFYSYSPAARAASSHGPAAAEAPAAEDAPEPTPTEPRELAKPTGEFDWDAFESEQDEYTSEERKRLEDLYESSLTLIKEKEVIEGTVISIGKKEVVVNIGYKSEGVIGASEFRYNPELKAGDKVPVFIEKQEDANGQLVVSHKTSPIYHAWDKVNQAKDEDMIIQGSVKCRTKGGLIVDVFGLEAFLPGSQVDVKPIRDFDEYVGKQMEFKVVKINQESAIALGTAGKQSLSFSPSHEYKS